MFRNRRSWTLPAAICLAMALSGLFASDALADGRKGKNGHRGHGHGHGGRPERVVVQVLEQPRWSAGLGVFVVGAGFDFELGNTPARGYGYWDPHRGTWIDDVRAYSTWCKRNDARPMIRVVRFDDRCSGRRG